MLNTIYSLKEISAYNKMIRLLMHGGQKNKATTIFFETIRKILKEKRIEKSQDKRTSQKFRNYGLLNKKISSDDIKWLGIESPKLKQSSKKKEFSQNQSFSLNKTIDKEQIISVFSILEHAIFNVSPFLEIRKVRVSGKTRQIPSMIQRNRQQTLAIRWLIEGAKKRKKKNNTFSDCLAAEFLGAVDKQGGARQKRNELHKIAHSNRTFLRYRWW